MPDVAKLTRLSNVVCRSMREYLLLCSFGMGQGVYGWEKLDTTDLCIGDGKMLHSLFREWRESCGWEYGNLMNLIDGEHPDMRSWEDLPQRRQELYRLVAALMSMGDL